MRSKMLRTLGTWTFALFLPFLAIGCNTMEGMGKDMESAGEEIQEEADDDEEDGVY